MADEQILIRVPEGLPRQLVVGYADKCRKGASELETAIEKCDLAFARVFGHRLKGTGAPYGFAELTEIGRAIEFAAAQNQQDELKKHTARLFAYLSRVEVQD